MAQAQSKAPAFQFYPAEFLADRNVMLMSAEEVGAYTILLSVCWIEESLPNDLEELAALARTEVSRFEIMWHKRLKGYFDLLPETNVFVHKKLEIEKQKQAEWREKCAKGGKQNASKRKKTQEITPVKGSTTKVEVNHDVYLNTSSSSSTSNIKEITNVISKKKIASRLSEDFAPSAALRAWASEKTPDVDAVLETEKFINYWLAKSGKDAAKLDWDATWRNWMLIAQDRVHPNLRTSRAPVAPPPLKGCPTCLNHPRFHRFGFTEGGLIFNEATKQIVRCQCNPPPVPPPPKYQSAQQFSEVLA